MLRSIVLILLLANVAFFAWHQGWLGESSRPNDAGQREPARLGQQIHPERISIQSPPAVARLASSAQVSGSGPSSAASTSLVVGSGPAAPAASATDRPIELQCMEAGPFTAEEQRRLERLWASILPATAQVIDTVDVVGLWLVYMGPYPDPTLLARKEQELRRIRNLNFEEVRSPPALSSGFSLGRFNTEAQASASLEALKLRGIRTARVVNVRPPMTLNVIRAPAVNTALAKQLASLALPPGKGFATCQPAASSP